MRAMRHLNPLLLGSVISNRREVLLLKIYTEHHQVITLRRQQLALADDGMHVYSALQLILLDQ